jgi:polar amino acid transport system substrate-binding protein
MLLLVFVFAPCLKADEHNIEVRVAIDNWPPWKIVHDQQFSGIDLAILHEVATRTNFQFTPVHCPWKRCIDMLKTGTVDMITSFTRTQEREAFAVFIEPPYFTDNVVFFVKRHSDLLVNSYEDLYGKRIGVVKGAAYFARFDADMKIDKTAVVNDQQLFKMLDSNRIDLLAAHEIPGKYMAKKYGFQEKIQPVTYKRRGVGLNYFAFSKKSQLLEKIPLFKASLESLEAEGTVERIITTEH